MSSSASSNTPVWAPYCPNSGVKHDTLYSDYMHCGECGKRNPRPPGAHQWRESSVAASQPRGDRPQTAAPPAHTTYVKPGKSVAEAHRRQGFKNNRPAIPNAGSRTLEHRDSSAGTEAQTPEKALKDKADTFFTLECELHLQKVLIKANKSGSKMVWHYSEPELYYEWVDACSGSEYVAAGKPMLPWLLSRAEDEYTCDIKNSQHFMEYHLIKGWSNETSAPKKIVRSLMLYATLERALIGYDQLGAVRDHRFKVMIVVLQGKDQRSFDNYLGEQASEPASAPRGDELGGTKAIKGELPSSPPAFRFKAASQPKSEKNL